MSAPSHYKVTAPSGAETPLGAYLARQFLGTAISSADSQPTALAFRLQRSDGTMPRGQPFFRNLSKTQLQAEIRLKISSHYFREVFESELLSDLIASKHYFCSVHGLRPDAFRKLPRVGGGYDFEGRFNGRWRGVSWTKCLDAWDDRDWLVRALRDSVQPIVSAYRAQRPLCERCAELSPEEVDHVAPEFQVMADAAIATMSPEQINQELLRFDWWNEAAFRLTPDCPAVAHILKAHETAVLQAVCKACHLRNASDRRTCK